MNEEERLHRLTQFIDLAFDERDPYMRCYFLQNLMSAKWQRAALLQGVL